MRAAAAAPCLVIALLFAACAVGSGDEGDDPIPRTDASISPDDGGFPVEPDPDPDPGTDGGNPDSGGNPGDTCAAALAAAKFDFESGAQGFTHAISDNAAGTASWPFDPWNNGTATNGTPCSAGKCFGAELTQNYAQCQRGHLLSPKIDLSACSGKGVSLTFKHAYTFWTGAGFSDGGIVEVSGDDGATWSALTGTYPGTVKIRGSLPPPDSSYKCVLDTSFYVNNKAGYVGVQTSTVTAELAVPNAALTSSVRIRFSFASGVSTKTTNADTSRGGTGFGWRIDDIAFIAK